MKNKLRYIFCWLSAIFLKKMTTPTLPKTNVAPENGWLEDYFPVEMAPFLGDMFVFRGVCFFSN